MDPLTIGIIGVLVLLGLMSVGVNIWVSFVVVAFFGQWALGGLNVAFGCLQTVPYRICSTYVFTVIPLFVFMGYLALHGKLTTDFYDAVAKWVRHVRGGLTMATMFAAAGFGSVTGDVVASAATMCSISLPEMRKYRYSDELSLGCIAAGGNLSFLIPPSLGFILYGAITTVSIGSLFIAGILPGILLTFLFAFAIYIICRVNPEAGPAMPRASWVERFAAIKNTVAIIALFLLVMGGIYIGIFTPTEAAAIGAFGAFILGIIYRRLTVRGFKEAAFSTARTTAMVFFLLFSCMVFNLFLALSGIPMWISNFLIGLPASPLAILAIILFVYVIIGCFMDVLSMILLTVPIFFPIITSLGYDPILFGVLVITTMMIGHLTPPFGIIVYVLKGMVPEVPVFRIFRGCFPFLGVMIIFLVILIAFPQISLTLPHLMIPS